MFMNIVIYSEPKPETRVTATPKRVESYKSQGFDVICMESAGEKSGFNDKDYRAAGATIL